MTIGDDGIATRDGLAGKPRCNTCGAYDYKRNGHLAECSQCLVDANDPNSAEPPTPRAGERERVEHSPLPWRVVIDDTGDPVTGGYPSICADESLDTTIVHVEGFHHEYWNSHPSQPIQVANARLIVKCVNQHATLVEQRDRLCETLQEARQFITKHVCVLSGSGQLRKTQTEWARRMVQLIDVVLSEPPVTTIEQSVKNASESGQGESR